MATDPPGTPAVLPVTLFTDPRVDKLRPRKMKEDSRSCGACRHVYSLGSSNWESSKTSDRLSLWASQGSISPNLLQVVRQEQDEAQWACSQSSRGAQRFLLLVFPRLIREQLLEGDFTVNMRLLQVMEFGGTCSVFSHEADT